MRDPDPASESFEPKPNHAIGRLLRRADFLRVAKGRRWHGKALTLQAVARQADSRQTDSRQAAIPGIEEAPPRAGLTVTKKTGNSVMRNRIRRRLREALRLNAPALPVRSAHDYVIVARAEALRLPFKSLQDELTRALRGVHAEARPRDATKRPKRTTASP